jgi:hypothetical protein
MKKMVPGSGLIIYLIVRTKVSFDAVSFTLLLTSSSIKNQVSRIKNQDNSLPDDAVSFTLHSYFLLLTSSSKNFID